ncbi:hypothetical protein EPH95_05360 [Salicibibacter halophilus]|uniref:Uncharacterized protein n=1 Tax=Salicibibacter halophilus TaxID=2502791 RepID=A0A514LFM7_9BACI|nr:hypothetical protein [Salicibibacter halophilus]QDI90677.1 hypothetical protein EPH95_05360 [Salicibibacter halophilus]
MSIKEEVIKTISELPDDVTYEDIMEEIFVQSKIEAGLNQLDEGKHLTHDQVKERMGKWLS